MRGLIVCLIAGAVLLSGVPETTFGQEVTSTISVGTWGKTRESRRVQAAQWLTEISKIEKQIPTLSPAEDAWLKKEYDDAVGREGLTPRVTRARHSKEGSTRFAKLVAQNMVAVLRELASSAPLPQNREVALWSRLAYLGLDLSFWGDVESLGDFGVLARSPQSKLGTPGMPTYQEFLSRIWASRAREILGWVVLPHVDTLATQ